MAVLEKSVLRRNLRLVGLVADFDVPWVVEDEPRVRTGNQHEISQLHFLTLKQKRVLDVELHY